MSEPKLVQLHPLSVDACAKLLMRLDDSTTKNATRSQTRGALMTIAVVAAERDDLKRHLAEANERIEEYRREVERRDELLHGADTDIADLKRQLAEAKREAVVAHGRVRALETALARVAVAINETHPDTALAIRQTLEGR